jgi:hypothetical protein
VENYDGTKVQSFAQEYRAAGESGKQALLAAMKVVAEGFLKFSVKLYDPQNIVVQWTSAEAFRLRLLDFEPATRSFIPFDSMLPFLVRVKTKRRMIRWMKGNLGITLKRDYFRRNGISPKLRLRWDVLIANEGVRMGLSDCKAFLENKLVNDIFYEGVYKGMPCIVKCSSRSPESIRNEYEVGIKLNTVNSLVFPKYFDCYVSDCGKYAFLVMEKLYDAADSRLASVGEDLISILRALDASGVVHRDVYLDNLMVGDDGHLKLIDFQFAVDRNRYEECAWMRRNWKYRYVVLGIVSGLPIGVWNDASGMMRVAERLCVGNERGRVVAYIKEYVERLAFSSQISLADRIRLRIYKHRLKVQNFLSFKGNKKQARQRRIQRLEWRNA